LLPAELLHAIAAPNGSRVVLVTGAGCSVEPPTNLPLSRECAEQAHFELVSDGVLAVGDCPDPSDLSALADAVVRKTGHQRDLVQRMHPNRFRTAEPNTGYRLAAILLRERALSCVVTLNFDLALSVALAMIGARDVEIIQAPEHHGQLGTINIVYLHRNANSDADSWILTTEALEGAWRDHWEEVISARFISGPVTVFAGLGSPAGVLLHSVDRLLAAIPAAGAHVYLVDPGPREGSRFFDALGLPDAAYIREGWSQFVHQLADRLLERHLELLRTACDSLVYTQNLPHEEMAHIWTSLRASGLAELGALRARLVLSDAAYMPSHELSAQLVADLLLAVGHLEELLHAHAKFVSDGIVEFREGARIVGVAVFASGAGVYRWARLDAVLRHKLPQLQMRDLPPRCAIVAGVVGAREMSAPESIILEEEPESLITGPSWFGMYTVDELRQRPHEIIPRIA
jgi:hypothetical protein